MATFSISDIRSRAKLSGKSNKTVNEILDELVLKQKKASALDVFLSISNLEPELIIGAALTLEDVGYSIYLDPHEDQNKEHSSSIKKISREKAKALSGLMDRCQGMIIVTTSAKSESLWQLWECGYFSGKKGRIAIMPITPVNAEIYRGESYLGLYPFITTYQTQNRQTILVVKYGTKVYCTLDNWFAGGEGLLE